MEEYFTKLQNAIIQVEKGESLEEVLENEFQYFKFIEKKLIPEIREENMYLYLKGIVEKKIGNGEIKQTKDLNIPNICVLSFKPSNMNPNYLSYRYPKLEGIILKVIEDIKKENYFTTESVLKMCKINIAERVSLKTSLQIYRESIDWKYLNFVEKVLISDVGESEFYQYVLDVQNYASSIGAIKTFSNSELLNIIINGEEDSKRGQVVNAKERYPILFDLVEKAVNVNKSKGQRGQDEKSRLNLKYQTNAFNKLTEYDFIKKCRDIIYEEFHDKRTRLNKVKFYRVLFNEPNLSKDSFYDLINDKLLHKYALNQLLENEVIRQINFMEQWNKESLDLKKNIWIVHFVRGLSLHSIKIDFNSIKREELRREVKTYLFYDYSSNSPLATYKKFTDIMRGLDVIQEKFNLQKLLDIDVRHVTFMYQFLVKESKFSVATIRKTLSSLSIFSDYYLYKNGYKNKPTENVFKSISMYNVDSMSKNTAFIPDEVIDQLNNHLSELDLTYRLMYEIYSCTGLRPIEVVELEIDCLDNDSDYEGYIKMNYIPHKIKKARRKRGLSEYNFVYISEELSLKIKEYIARNTEVYTTHNLKYIFARRTNAGVFTPKTRDFCLSINRIIKKYKICDFTGELWNFTTKQIRKTVAVNLIENNATPQEISNQLGHLSIRTTEKYYMEVKKASLAELNSEFFKSKFEISIGKENLDLYSEEERRELYIDFCLNKREVELGTCTKHKSEGECGSRIGASSCAVCPKLCTGKKYLEKWSELKESQYNIVNELKRIYEDKGIEEYHEFVEYKKEVHMLNRYSNVISEILGG